MKRYYIPRDPHLSDQGRIARDARRTQGADLQLHVVHLRLPHANDASLVVGEEEAVERVEPQVSVA